MRNQKIAAYPYKFYLEDDKCLKIKGENSMQFSQFISLNHDFSTRS